MCQGARLGRGNGYQLPAAGAAAGATGYGAARRFGAHDRPVGEQVAEALEYGQHIFGGDWACRQGQRQPHRIIANDQDDLASNQGIAFRIPG
jgi:hypothetical protein